MFAVRLNRYRAGRLLALAGAGVAASAVTVVVDEQTAFPLLEIDGLDFAVGWLPVTLMQMELFLSDISNPSYNANWYLKTILKDKQRISPHKAEKGKCADLFVTNVELHEIRRVTDWFSNGVGHHFSLPTSRQWQNMRDHCRRCPRLDVGSLPNDVDPRVRVLLVRLQDVLKPVETLADQMLLGNGEIEEYVLGDDGGYSCGFVDRRGVSTPFKESLAHRGVRRNHLTFRLICWKE